MMRRLSAAVAGCYAAVQFHLFKPSDILGDFLKCVGGNPAYVDAAGFEMDFIDWPPDKQFIDWPPDNQFTEVHIFRRSEAPR